MHVVCPYCNRKAAQVDGRTVYPHRPDLSEKQFYACMPCEAWVGCHLDRDDGQVFAPQRIDGEWEWGWMDAHQYDDGPPEPRPLGTLANAELRALRSRVHALLDPLWQSHPRGQRRGARRVLYAGMASHFGFTEEQCHVGMFREAECRAVLAWLAFSSPF